MHNNNSIVSGTFTL